ncbi:MAG: PilZ domain-containing protein [Candidatus Omnitrophota bacterium]
MQDERRLFERLSTKLPAVVRAQTDGSVFEAQIQDLAAKGLGITSRDRIPQEGRVNLRIEIPGQKNYLNLVGQIVWSRENFPDGWRAGIWLREQSTDLVSFSVLLDKANR